MNSSLYKELLVCHGTSWLLRYWIRATTSAVCRKAAAVVPDGYTISDIPLDARSPSGTAFRSGPNNALRRAACSGVNGGRLAATLLTRSR